MKRLYTNLYKFAMRFHFVKQDFKTMQTDFEITPPHCQTQRLFATDPELALLQKRIHNLYELKKEIAEEERQLREKKIKTSAELTAAIDRLSAYLNAKNLTLSPPPPK